MNGRIIKNQNMNLKEQMIFKTQKKEKTHLKEEKLNIKLKCKLFNLHFSFIFNFSSFKWVFSFFCVLKIICSFKFIFWFLIIRPFICHWFNFSSTKRISFFIF